MVCLENRDHSVVFEIAPKYCILDSFVGYDGYSISSKGFLPVGIDIMVIWIKFAHPVHFSSLISKMSAFTLAISYLTTSNLPWHGRNIPGSCALLFFFSIRLYFHRQTHPQLDIVFALAQPFHSFWSYLSAFLCSILGTIDLWSSSFRVISFCLFILLMGLSR